jgi:acetyl-CoA carboxylase biotin carboxyl carrier protein
LAAILGHSELWHPASKEEALVSKAPKKSAAKAAPARQDPDELSLIRKLADMLNSTGLTEIELERGTSRIRVSKAAQMAPSHVSHVMAPAAGPTIGAGAVASAQAAPISLADHPGLLKSPMVGTAYLAPSPGAAQFVTEGSTVKQGQTVVIIEAMKTMNQIVAHASGKVVQILVQNGQPVEFGEQLMVIE